ncbi:MAG: sugar phosphate isomerase/epimerase [Phycisphaeraceae bacterium]|nr:sugar phosphate isomerase/epimerase [Phycisphaeraceae bacterium]
MPTLTHGSDLRLAPTLGPVVQASRKPPRQGLTVIGEQGFAAVQLDATLPGLRPRELDTTARRDVLSTAMRAGLTIAGIDFFIPAEHYHDPRHVDRAVEAAVAACSLAGDLGRVPVSLNLPTKKVDPSLSQMIADSADAYGVTLAIHDESDLAGLAGWLSGHGAPHIGMGLDPAALLIRDRDPAGAAQSHSSLLRVARLSDASKGQADGGRQVVGMGSLQVMAYRVSVDLAPDRIGPVVLDLRGSASPLDAMRSAKPVWDNAAVAF